jgi:hypothetical protein
VSFESVLPFLFGLLWLVIALFAVRTAARLLVVLRLLRNGARAEGRCVRRRLEEGPGPGLRTNYAAFYFGFRTPEGESVTFQDRAGAGGMTEGAPVEVRYDPRAPKQRATIAGPGRWGPVYVNALLLAGLGFFTLFPVAVVLLAYS